MVSYVKFVSGLYCSDVSLTIAIVVRYGYYCPVSRNNWLFIVYKHLLVHASGLCV